MTGVGTDAPAKAVQKVGTDMGTDTPAKASICTHICCSRGTFQGEVSPGSNETITRHWIVFAKHWCWEQQYVQYWRPVSCVVSFNPLKQQCT